MAGQAVGVIDAGAEFFEPVGGLRADIEIRGREHHRRHDVIGQNGDPVRPLRPYARGVDEDEIRRVRRIDLLDPAIHGPHALDGRRAQER